MSTVTHTLDGVTRRGGPDLRVGDVVAVRFAKWGERPHWAMDLRYLGEDKHGHWAGGPKGFHMSRPGLALDSVVDLAMLVPRAQPFVASFHGPCQWCDIYVDISTVPVWDGSTMRAVDLDLDVVRALDGRGVLVDDEDEFAAHQVSYGYPPDVIALAKRSCDDVVAAMTAAGEPWATVGHGWVEVAARTAPVPRGESAGSPGIPGWSPAGR